MADISGVGSSIAADVSAFNSTKRADDSEKENSSLSKLREELLEEARAVAREAAKSAEDTSSKAAPAAVAAASPTNLQTLQRSTPANKERPRGYQAADLEDKVVLSPQAKEIIETNQKQTVQDENTVNVKAEEANRSNFTEAVDQRVENEDDLLASLAQNVSDSSKQQSVEDDNSEANPASNGVAANDDNSSSGSSEEFVATFDPTNAPSEAAVAANDGGPTETNQVTVNEDDTTEVNGNTDASSRPQGERVLGQIIDQFA